MRALSGYVFLFGLLALVLVALGYVVLSGCGCCDRNPSRQISGKASRPSLCTMAARPLQFDEPVRIRRVQPGKLDCELEVWQVVECENFVRIEIKIGIDSIADVSHLSWGGEAASGEIFADEGEILKRDRPKRRASPPLSK